MSGPEREEERPDHPDDEMPKLTAEEWAYVQAVVDAEKNKDAD